MSKLGRGAAVLVAASLAVPMWGVQVAGAEEQTVLAPSAAGYFNAEGIRKPDESPAAPPNVTSNVADGVAPDHLAVAARAGSESKVSFLLFDLFDLGLDVTISKAVLTVPVAPDGGGNVSIAPAPEKVVACPAGEGGFLGDDGTSIQDAPERMCDASAVKAVATADGAAYAFDISSLAQTWVTDMNNGVALTSDPAARSTAFQRVFKPAEEAKLALTFTAADGSFGEIEVPTVPEFPTTDTGGGSSDLGGSFDGGSFDSPDTGLGTVSEPALTADEPVLPADAAAEEPALASPEVAATVPVASTMRSSLTPPLSFWVGLLLLAALLALLSLILGDPRVAQTSTRQTRLSQALQARQRGDGLRGTRPALGL